MINRAKSVSAEFNIEPLSEGAIISIIIPTAKSSKLVPLKWGIISRLSRPAG